MKYYLVKSVPTKIDPAGNIATYDEPQWLRDEVKTWKKRFGVGGRYITDDKTLQSFIISPIDLIEFIAVNKIKPEVPSIPLSISVAKVLTDNLDIIELAREDAQEWINKREPLKMWNEEVVKKNETETTEFVAKVKPSPKLEVIEKYYYGTALNHTGSISADEVWTLADSPHHITGNITTGADISVSGEAGITIIYDGDYSITMTAGSGGGSTTKFLMVGTSALPITITSNASLSGTGTNADWTEFTLADNCIFTLTYCNVSNCKRLHNDKECTVTHSVSNCLLSNISNMIVGNQNPKQVTYNFNNCLFRNIIVINSLNLTGTRFATINYTNCKFINATFLTLGATTNSAHVVNVTDCFFDGGALSGDLRRVNVTFTRCLLNGNISSSQVQGIVSVSNSIGLRNFRFTTPASVTGAWTATGSDIINNFNSSTLYAFNSGATPVATPVLTSCWISGWLTADSLYPYTGVETPAQTTGTITFTTPRTFAQGRNFKFIPTSVTASAVGNNGATIEWTVDFRTRNRVQYGTASGVYTIAVEPTQKWSNYDGKGAMTVSPSIVLQNLKPATLYYYIAESFDWATDDWVKSSEETFTTTNESFVKEISVLADSINYYTGATVTAIGAIKLQQATVGTKVKLEVRKVSDDSLIDTLMNDVLYNFVANTSASLATINGSAPTWTGTPTGEYYLKLTLSGGSPALSTNTVTTISEKFKLITQTAFVKEVSLTTDAIHYFTGSTVTASGAIKLDISTVGTKVKLEVRKVSDGSLISTLMNDVLYNFTADTSATLLTINGSNPTYSAVTADSYYLKLTLSAGAPALDSISVSTVSEQFKVDTLTAYVKEASLLADDTEYYNGATLTASGAIKLNIATIGTKVKLEVRKASDDSLIATLMNDVLHNFLADTSETLATINGGAPTWVINSSDVFYLKLTLSAGAPALDTNTVITVSEKFSAITRTVFVKEISLQSDKPQYFLSETLTASGAIKLDYGTIGTVVTLEVRKVSDGSLIHTILSGVTYNFIADTSASLQTINGGIAPTWTPLIIDAYYLKLTLSGGAPALDTNTVKTISENFTVITGDMVITNYQLSNYAPMQCEYTTASCEVSGTPADVVAIINNIPFKLTFVAGTLWSASISGLLIGECTTASVIFMATNAIDGIEVTDALTITIPTLTTYDINAMSCQIANILATITDLKTVLPYEPAILPELPSLTVWFEGIEQTQTEAVSFTVTYKWTLKLAIRLLDAEDAQTELKDLTKKILGKLKSYLDLSGLCLLSFVPTATVSAVLDKQNAILLTEFSFTAMKEED